MLDNPLQYSEEQLRAMAKEIRIDIIKMLLESKSGHTGGSLGMADVFAALYGKFMHYDPKSMSLPDRDRLILSNGHICPVLYVTLANVGIFPHDELATFRKINSRLQGHPHVGTLPGIEVSSGPLGQGISQALGFALAGKLTHRDYKVFCIVSDGENQEGQFWESLMFASKNKLDNLFIIVDKNNIQLDGFIQDIMPIEPLDDKYKAFNLETFQMNGNDIPDICYVLKQALQTYGNRKPKIISANTILGKGVPFMENNFDWHGKAPNADEAKIALDYLNA